MGLARTLGVALVGVEGHLVEVEADLGVGIPSYTLVGRDYASHETVDHNREYVRGDAHTNTAENFFSILKRGINGVYHHVSEAHLPRYLSEFDFRYNTRAANGFTDSDRTRLALSMVEGKRLRYAD